MKEIQHKKGKVFYSMGEVTEMFDVNPSLIRFWESRFDILKPHKNKKGNRMFTPEDVDSLNLIYHLVKEQGMTLAGAQKRIKDNRDGTRRDMEVVDRLMTIKALLQEIKQELRDEQGAVNVDNEYDDEGAETIALVEEIVDDADCTLAAEPVAETPFAEEPDDEGAETIALMGAIVDEVDCTPAAEPVAVPDTMQKEDLAMFSDELDELDEPDEAMPEDYYEPESPVEVFDPVPEESFDEPEFDPEEPDDYAAARPEAPVAGEGPVSPEEEKPKPYAVEQTLF